MIKQPKNSPQTKPISKGIYENGKDFGIQYAKSETTDRDKTEDTLRGKQIKEEMKKQIKEEMYSIMNNFRKEYELGDFEPIKLDTAIVELMIRGRKQALEEVEKVIDEFGNGYFIIKRELKSKIKKMK